MQDIYNVLYPVCVAILKYLVVQQISNYPLLPRNFWGSWTRFKWVCILHVYQLSTNIGP